MRRRRTAAMHGQKLNFRSIPNNTNANWWLDPCLRWNMFHLLALCGTLYTNGYCGSLLNGLQSLDQWQTYFDHPTTNILGLMNSAGFLPGVVFSFLSDRCGDRFGRHIPIYGGTILVLIGVVIMGLSKSVGMFCGGRAVLGAGNYSVLTMAPSLLQEIAHPRLRAQMGAFFMSIYYVAAFVSAVVCLGCYHLQGEVAWRIPVWLQLIGPTITLLILPTMPESPRWLAKKGREEDARHVLVKYHANGKEDDELVEHEFREILAALRDESASSQVRYSDYLRTRGNRHRLLILIWVALGTNWGGNGEVSYYLSPILDSLGITSAMSQLEILVGIHLWNIIVATLAAISVERVGRRLLWLVSTGGMLIFMVVIMLLSALYIERGISGAGEAVIPFIFLFFGSYDLAWTPLTYSYPVEILTFSMRTKGQALFVAVQTLSISLNTWVNPLAMAAIEWRYYAVSIGFLCASMTIIFFYFPETKGLTIEEIALLFDEDTLVANLNSTATTHGGGTDTVTKEGLNEEIFEISDTLEEREQ